MAQSAATVPRRLAIARPRAARPDVPPRRVVNRLKLGPIVGHTSESVSTIWIQVFDDPSVYALLVQGAGLFQFASTEAPGPLEFRTAIAIADGLRPDWRYTYTVLRKGRRVPSARGTFRTMPQPGSTAMTRSISSSRAALPGVRRGRPSVIAIC